MQIIAFLVVGLIVGALARFVVPGRDSMGLIGTMVLGVVGSFVGGFLVTFITTRQFALTSAGWIGSIVGAVLVLLVVRNRGGKIL